MKKQKMGYDQVAYQLQRFQRSNFQSLIMGSGACNETTWKFLVELYVWSEDLREPSAEDIALAIDVPVTLVLRIAGSLRKGGFVVIGDGPTAADLRISLTDAGYERVGAYLEDAAGCFSDEKLSMFG